MAFTGVLGNPDGNFGNFALGRANAAPPINLFDPVIIQDLTLSDTTVLSKTLNLTVEQTLTMTQRGHLPDPLIPIVGYSGGQTRYVFVTDLTAKQDLYALNPDDVFEYPASVTKLMTFLLLLEYQRTGWTSNTVTFNSADVTLPGGISTGGFASGDICTWKELATAIITQSAGDACQCAARYIGTQIYTAAGSTGNTGMTRFHERMNDRAAELDMTGAVYFDSWGNSKSSGVTRNQMTARSLAKLMAELLTNHLTDASEILGIASTSINVTGTSPRTLNFAQVNYFINGPTDNPSGIKDDNCIGGKVGEWNSDGTHLNLANAFYAPNGNIIIVVTMNSETYYAMTLDQQGLVYSYLRDWAYLYGDLSPSPDANFADVRLLVGADVGLADDSNYGRTITGTLTQDATPVLWGRTNGLKSAAKTANLEAADAADLEIGANDGCVEVWWMGPAGGDLSALEQNWLTKYESATQREFAINYYPSQFTLFVSTDVTNWTNTSAIRVMTTEERKVFLNGSPRHIAFVKSGSSIYAYLNGEKMGSITAGTIANSTAKMRIGATSADSSSPLGWFDEWRVTIGAARYTANKFTLLPVPFPRSIVPVTPASNAISLSHTVGLIKYYSPAVEHELSLTHHAYRTRVESVAHDLTLVGTATFEKFKKVSAVNALAMTHDVDVVVEFQRFVNQGMALLHQARMNIRKVVNPTNTVSFVQVATGLSSKLAKNELALDQVVEVLVAKSVKHFLDLESQVQYNGTFNRSLISLLIPSQTVQVQKTTRRTLVNTLPVTHSVVGFAVKSAKDVLALSQTVVGTVTKPTYNLLALGDFAGLTRSVGLPADNFVGMSQFVALVKSRLLHAANAFGMNQFVKANRVLTRSVEDTLALAQELVREYKIEELEQLLDLGQTVEVSKVAPRTAENVLTLAQSVVVSKTLVRALEDTLVFHNTFNKYVGIQDREYVSVPAVQVVKVKKIVVLQSDNMVITLPAPEFNDTEGGTGRINIKRSMDGARRIYTRDNITSKLNYQFIMDRRKAIELRNFILNNNTKFLTMTNWKGEIWAVQMTNSPFSFGEDAAWLGSPGGNKSSINLEFEGVRLN